MEVACLKQKQWRHSAHFPLIPLMLHEPQSTEGDCDPS